MLNLIVCVMFDSICGFDCVCVKEVVDGIDV